MKTANCPSCGAPVTFKSSASVYAVCEFCRSTLLLDGEDLKNLGRMADLMDDPSLIQIGSEGKFRGVHFGVIGRIQLRYDAGLWNEWHILFDDGRNGWLSEAGGEYVVSALVPVATPLPAFESLEPEMLVRIGSQDFAVSDLQTARCISGQGELPFKVDAGYDVNAADLRGNDRLVTIDYSETPPIVFVGYPAAFDELTLANLREKRDVMAGGAPTVKARAFNCPHCAAPLTIHSAAIESVGCNSCGSVIGIDNENIQLLQRAAQSLKIEPWLPLGSKGKLNDIDWEAIGFMRRSTRSDGIDYAWSEYLLFNEKEGFSWLTEYQGHWNFARTLSKPPSVARGQYEFYRGKAKFKLFSTGKAEVDYVVGEFYWRVSVGETCLVEDYICPPEMLSREVTNKEASWSQADYLEPEALRAAFGIAFLTPARIGVYANQPNPHEAGFWKSFSAFWKLGVLATLVQLAFVFFFSSQVVLKQQLVLSPFNHEATVTSQEFVLHSRARSLRVKHGTDLENNWVSIVTTLIEKQSGEAYQGVQELAYYKGYEDGESWSEGSKDDAIAFRNVPPGTYYLNIEYDLADEKPNVAVADKLEVVRNPAGWSNYILVMIFLAAFPLYARWRKSAFETRRWAESDLGGGDDDSGDDDDE